MSDETLFHLALDKTAAERPAFLEQACAGDDALRQRVEALLRSHGTPDSFLVRSPEDTQATADSRPIRMADGEGTGSRIGPYKLLQPIGEGGMGTVYMAEQSQPVRRTVALKLIRAGMDSKQVLARFRAERQALALMDHPNIARVFDAGTTDTGRPYFVMELVKGIPITRFCDERRLTTRERLELAIPVCQAVQHAHQKGIIHRDLKPSNVLIALYDRKPVPKVIDFGVAKATGPRLTDQTLYTEFGAVVGTLEYMSPEQAQLNQLDIDTRSDIYSLGVLLYELLTGSTPLDRKRLKEGAILEMLRVIREEESPRPSMRLSTTEELPSIAACRNIEPRKLSGLMRGELDWIVMKALEKDRNRRYETANGLAADLRRYLDDEPVLACPPSAWYRFGKFARRNRGPVLAAALVLVALLAGVVGTTWGLIRAEQARQAEAGQRALAEANEQKALEQKRISEAVRSFLQQDLLRQADATEQANAVRQAGGGFETTENPTIKELLDRAAAELTPGKIEAKFPRQPEVQASILQTVGATYWGIGEYAKAVEFLTRARDTYQQALGVDHPDTLTTLEILAGAYLSAGKTAQAVVLFKQICDGCVKELGADHPRTLFTRQSLAGAFLDAGRTAEAVALFEQLRDACVKNLGAEHPLTLTTLHNMAQAYRAAGKTAEAITLYEQVRNACMKTLGADHPFTLANLDNLAGAFLLAGRTDEAVVLFEQVRDARVKKLGADHPHTLFTLNNLAEAYRAAGKTAEAIALHDQVRDARVRKLGADHPDTLTTLATLALAYEDAGKPEQALPLIQQAAEGIEKRQFVHPHAGLIVGALVVDYYERLKQYDQAAVWQRKWLAVVKERSGADSLPHATEIAVLGMILLKQKKWTEAEAALHDCLAIREKKQPDDWTTFNTQSMLGGALNGQRKPTEAEPLLVQGYEGLRQRAANIPKEGKPRLAEALERLVHLYDGWGRPDEATRWRKELERVKAGAKPQDQP